MRPQHLPLMTLLAVGVAAPAWAQLLTPATPETVVARLMSFDRNADGRIVADELPERLHSLLARGDSSSDGALDRAEVLRLARSPAPQIPIRAGFDAGRYGFGEGVGFDTSRLIDGAVDDLRLASDLKERVLAVAGTFRAGADARVQDDLLAAMSRLLTGAQLDDFRAAAGGGMVSVPAIRRDGVTIFGANPEEAAGQERVLVNLRPVASDLERHIEKYGLDADRRQQALVAIREFKAHKEGRLNETERSALMEQLRGLLTDEQRDDLRAALGRRPVVKLAGVAPSAATLFRFVSPPQTTQPSGTFGAQDLVLKP